MVTVLTLLSWRFKTNTDNEATEIASDSSSGSDSIIEETDAKEEDRLCLILDSIPIPVWLRDPEFNLAYVNKAARSTNDFLSYCGTKIAERARANGQAHTEKISLETGNTQQILKITESPLGRGPVGTIGLASEDDTAELLELQHILTHERAIFDQLINNLSSGIAIFGPDKRLGTFNSAFALMWELPEGWLSQHPTLTQILERLRDERRLTEVVNFSVYRNEEIELFNQLKEPLERMMHLPDGRTLKNSVLPITTGGLIYLYDDLTGTLNLRRSNKTLEAVRRHTINNLQECIAVFGADNRIQLYNTAFTQFWRDNLDENQLEPHLSDMIDRMRNPEEVDSEWLIRRTAILSSLNKRHGHRDRFRCDDDRVYDITGVPLPDGATLISFLDVTEETKVEDALRSRNEILEETDRLKSKFIADISYEVRTPLNTIIGFSQILDAGYFGELSSRQKEYVNGVQITATSLMTIVADILELAAIEGGTAELKKDAIDVHTILAQAVKLITERARHKDIYVTFDVPLDIGWISADEKRLKQIVFNLLSNAINFTPTRGGVRLSASRDNEKISIVVADTGVGIPQGDIDRVFQKFERGSNIERDTDGAGLGLAMVKSFVELHGGHVVIKSAPNKGTKVTISLPATGTEGSDARNAFTI